ncbi:MAG: DUF3291 domain-containing protein, partial [Cryomorphaceae bacterium]
FALIRHAMNIMRQMQQTSVVQVKTSGMLKQHYTMSLWKDDASRRAFAREGAHLEAMKESARIAKEIITLTIEADQMPSWKNAKRLLEKDGKRLHFR